MTSHDLVGYDSPRRGSSQESDGSSIEHLARICAWSEWKTVNMAMLTAAIDCSKDKDRKYFVMAGLVSSAEEWSAFDSEWRARLATDSLAYFHMNPFAHASTHPQKPFDKSWIGQQARREALLSDLLDIIHSHAWRKFVCMLPINVLDAFSLDSRRHYIPSLIAFAGQLLWTEIEKWRREEKWANQVKMVFEQGDEDVGTLINVMKAATGVIPSFGHKKDNPEKGIVAFTPLQASDILAYEVQKLVGMEGRPHGEPFRFPYHQLEKIPGGINLLSDRGAKIHESAFSVMEYFYKNPLNGGLPQ